MLESWRSRWGGCVVVVATLLGCPGVRPGVEFGSPPSAKLDLRRLASRPRLAVLTRDGDPQAAIAVAIASAGGSTTATAANRGLRTMLQERLRLAGFAVIGSSDGAGLRLAAQVSSADAARRLVRAVATAMATPLGDDVGAMRAELESLDRTARTHAARIGVAQCSGEAVLRPQERASDLGTPELETLRRATFAEDAVALGVVGPDAITRATASELEQGPAWGFGAAAAAGAAPAATHSVGVSSAIREGEATLELAWRLADPRRSVQSVLALGQQISPFTAKLAALEEGWKLDGLRATALVDGGCVSMRFAAKIAPARQLARSAAEVVAIADAELRAELREPLEQATVAKQVAEIGDALTAAERAAWWALAGMGREAEPRLITSLSQSALGRESEIDEDDLRAQYQAALATPIPRAPLERRVAVERGQGRSWMLVASECAVTQEEAFDAGRGALAVLTSASDLSDGDLEPWLEPEGLGIIASVGSVPNDSPTAAARRLARTAAIALTRRPLSEPAFTRAHTAIVSALTTESSAAFELLATRALPTHPSWVSPLGLLSRQLAMTRSDADRRLRDLIHGPLRVAVLSNEGAEQGELVVRELDRWLAARGSDSCPLAALESPAAGEFRRTTRGPMGRLLVGAVSHSAQQWPAVELVAQALGSEHGPLAKATRGPSVRVAARWLGGRRAPTLGIELTAPVEAIDGSLASVKNTLAELRTSGLASEDLSRASAEVAASRERQRRDPRGRLASLWLGDDAPIASAAGVRAWLAQSFDVDRLVIVVQGPELD